MRTATRDVHPYHAADGAKRRRKSPGFPLAEDFRGDALAVFAAGYRQIAGLAGTIRWIDQPASEKAHESHGVIPADRITLYDHGSAL
jgi:hypothetical protein